MIVHKGARIVEMPKRSRTYPGVRVCGHDGCSTKLSTYNREDTCFIHRTRKAPRLRGRNCS
jgi:hypothetical protein